MLLQPGANVGPYTIQERLGSGGMATVYRVRHDDGSEHALKVLRQTEDPRMRNEMLRRFLAEGRIQKQLTHPHILPVTGLVEGPPTALVMDLLHGEDLGARMARSAPLPPLQSVRWIQQLLSALALIHSHGIIHRDLKPGNVFLQDTADGPPTVRVMDFGLARVLSLSQTKTGVIIGSLCYLSPEQIRDNKAVDHRADLFSVGALLYEMLAGVKAFLAESEFAVMQRIRGGNIVPLGELCPDLPEALAAVVHRAMATHPDERFADAAAFSAALQAVADTGTIPEQVTVQPNAAEANLLRRKIGAKLNKSLARLGRPRGGLGGLPSLDPIDRLFALATRLPALPLPALQETASDLSRLIQTARTALTEWEADCTARIEALHTARRALRRARAENQQAAIDMSVASGLFHRRRWRARAADRSAAVAAAAEQTQAALEALPELPQSHPLAVEARLATDKATAALATPPVLHTPPPLSVAQAVTVGVVLGLLGAAALIAAGL